MWRTFLKKYRLQKAERQKRKTGCKKVQKERGKQNFASPALFSFLLLEQVFAYAAQRAYEIIREIFEFSAGGNAALGVTLFLVIDPAACSASIFFHVVTTFLVNVLNCIIVFPIFLHNGQTGEKM